MNHGMNGSVGDGTDTVTHYFRLNLKYRCRIKAPFFPRSRKCGDEQNRDYGLIQERGREGFSWRSCLPSFMVSLLLLSLTDLVSLQFLQFLDFCSSALTCLFLVALSKQYSFNIHLSLDLCKAVSELRIFLRKLFKSRTKMFPRCFRYSIQSHTGVQKEELKKKKSIVGETKFVQKRLRIWSCQKMSSWSSQVLEGIEECKCGINLFIQREPREGKWSRNSVSLLLFSAVMKEILWCFINTVLVSYPKPIALQGSMKKSAPFQPDTAHFSKSLQYCLFEQLWFSDNDEWESSDLNMP